MANRSESNYPSQSQPSLFAPSCHMRLGCGLSSLVKSLHVSCFDLGSPMEVDLEARNIRQSMSESDLSSIFGSSEHDEKKSYSLRKKHSQLAANSMNKFEAMECESDDIQHEKES